MTESVLWEPTTKQAMFIDCPARETVFGGARGGGKSDAVCGDWLAHSERYGRSAKGLMVRRRQVQLDDIIERMATLYEPLGAVWQDQKKTFRMPSGSVLRMRYLDNERDADEYQGHSYTRVYPEELTNFTSFTPIGKLLATCRSAHGVPAQMKATCNPGGLGHLWVKARYIDIAPAYTPYSDNGGKSFRVYIPSLLSDNPRMDDPDGYREMLKLAGSPALVKAWLTGDWNIVEGAFFPEWAPEQHIIPAREIPARWTHRIRGMDWGSSRPYCVLWAAVADGHTPPEWRMRIPAGALVIYREMYGWGGKPNVGTRETAPVVGRKIALVEAEYGELTPFGSAITSAVIDPACFIANGGPSIAEMIASGSILSSTGGAGVWFGAADNTRRGKATAGWEQVRHRLTGEDGVPMLYVMDSCRHLIRTLPALPADPTKFDDVDTNSEDHAGDTLRYICNSRPYIGALPPDTGSTIEQLNRAHQVTLGNPNDTLSAPHNWGIEYMRRN